MSRTTGTFTLTYDLNYRDNVEIARDPREARRAYIARIIARFTEWVRVADREEWSAITVEFNRDPPSQ